MNPLFTLFFNSQEVRKSPFITLKSTAYSFFSSCSMCVHPLSSHSIPLLTPFPTPSGCVLPFYPVQIHGLLHFRLTVCAYILFLIIKPTIHSIFVSRMYAHPLSCNRIHCLLHFRLPVCGSIPSIAFKFPTYSIFVSQGVRTHPLSSHSSPLLTPALPIFAPPVGAPFSFVAILITPFSSPRRCVLPGPFSHK